VGSFDVSTQGRGHQGLADAIGVTNTSEWRGFVVTADGKFSPTSHFNLVDGDLAMKADHEGVVRQMLLQAGLIS
jgi:hypothetical protein